MYCPGQQEFGEKSVICQAQIYVDLATLHAHNFVTPRVTFVFFHAVPLGLRTVLTNIGVRVCEAGELFVTDASSADNLPWRSARTGDVCSNNSVDEASNNPKTLSENCDKQRAADNLNFCDKSAGNVTSESENDSEVCCLNYDRSLVMLMSPRDVPAVTKVNLDVTALIALVSNICHGACNLVFIDTVLSEQAAEEREKPVLPSLQVFLQYKHLTACETALRDFCTILDTIGGPMERKRADALLSTVRRIVDNPSAKAASLRSSARVTDRARIVFGTGDSERAVTVSANGGFVRAASQAGIEFTVFLHSARALTERKEANAKPFIASNNVDS